MRFHLNSSANSVAADLNDIFEVSNVFHFMWISAGIYCIGFLVLVNEDISGFIRFPFTLSTMVLELFCVGWMGDKLVRTMSEAIGNTFMILMECIFIGLHPFTCIFTISFLLFDEQSIELSNGIFNGNWYKAEIANIKDLPFIIQICQQQRTIKLNRFWFASYITSTNIS